MSIKLIRTVLLTAIHPAPTETESPTPIHPTIAARGTSDTATRSQKTEEGTRIPPMRRAQRTGGSRAEEI